MSSREREGGRGGTHRGDVQAQRLELGGVAGTGLGGVVGHKHQSLPLQSGDTPLSAAATTRAFHCVAVTCLCTQHVQRLRHALNQRVSLPNHACPHRWRPGLSPRSSPAARVARALDSHAAARTGWNSAQKRGTGGGCAAPRVASLRRAASGGYRSERAPSQSKMKNSTESNSDFTSVGASLRAERGQGG